MAKKTRKKATTKKKRVKRQSDMEEILTTLLITQLALAEVPNRRIRAIVGGDMNRVSKITQQLNAAKKAKQN